MSRPSQNVSLADWTKAYWTASCIVQSQGSAVEARQRATCVLQLLARSGPTPRLAGAAATAIANHAGLAEPFCSWHPATALILQLPVNNSLPRAG